MFIPSLKTRFAQNLSVGFGHTHTWAHPYMIQYTYIFLQNKEHRLQNGTMWLPEHQVNVWLSTTPQIYNQECEDKWSTSYSYPLSPSTFWIDYYRLEQTDITTFSQTSTMNKKNCTVYAHCIAAVTEFWILHKKKMFTHLMIPCHGLCRQILFICCYSVSMTS